MTELKEFKSDKIFKLKESENDKRRKEIEDMLNYQLEVARVKGEFPKIVTIGWSHIYNTTNGEEVEKWKRRNEMFYEQLAS